ncbi:NAD(P)-dependent oxidoreductase [Variovorax paradoxus]|nr:NAD(P)-dependent oxidoreductase [Variovorax paradoxus]
MNDVAVIGLGAMGVTLARLFLRSGRRVTVWNRSEDKARPLLAEGATLAASAADAVRSSRLAVMCVYDYHAARAIWAMEGVAAALDGRTLVHLSTGSPEDARRALAWAREHGGRYLDGAIQAAPSQMGQPDTPVLISGDASTYAAVAEVLKVLAGNIVYLGDQIDAAATMDLATLSYVYGAFAGFVHGARLAESQGLDVARFGQIVNAISPSFGAFFQHEAAVIQSGDYRITESPLRISIEATQRILDSSRAAGINTDVPALFTDLLRRAGQAGLGNEELAALIKVLR